jgi:hypothetical protein
MEKFNNVDTAGGNNLKKYLCTNFFLCQKL